MHRKPECCVWYQKSGFAEGKGLLKNKFSSIKPDFRYKREGPVSSVPTQLLNDECMRARCEFGDHSRFLHRAHTRQVKHTPRHLRSICSIICIYAWHVWNYAAEKCSHILLHWSWKLGRVCMHGGHLASTVCLKSSTWHNDIHHVQFTLELSQFICARCMQSVVEFNQKNQKSRDRQKHESARPLRHVYARTSQHALLR